MTASRLSLSLLVAVCAALAIRAEERGPRHAVYLFKPLATVLILLLALTTPEPVEGGYRALVAGGLLFSLLGDVFLMLPRDRFVAGLASFLAAHLLYAAAFAPWPPTLAAPVGLAILLLYGGWLMRALWPRLGGMRAPVAAYAAALLGMAWQSAERWAVLGTMPALLAAAGAMLFVASDSMLAWQRFVRPLRGGSALVLGTYYAAQWLIAMSVTARPFG